MSPELAVARGYLWQELQRTLQLKEALSCRGIEDELHQRNKGSLLEQRSDVSSHRGHGLRESNFATRYAMARELTKGSKSQKELPRDVKSFRETSFKTPSSFQAELLCAGAVFLTALLLYAWTLAPTVTPTDSGELIL